MKLSLAMIVKNEEEKLARCLDSIKKYVDEIVIVDTGSTDRTKVIAESFGAHVFDFVWCNDFSKARNFSIEKTTGDYVFVLDADNVILDFPKEKVMKFLKGKKVLGLAEIINCYTENGQKIVHKSLAGAIFPREARYVRAIHEHIDFALPRVKLPVSIFHDGYDNRDASKFKRNIDILEKALKDNDDAYLMYKLAKEYKGLNQMQKADEQFAKAYRMSERNTSNFPNIVVEYLSNLIDLKYYSEALQLINNEEKNFTDFPEFYFVCGDFYLELVLSDPQKNIQYFNRIKESYEKCISIGENPKYQGVVGMGSFMAFHNLGTFYEVIGNFEKAEELYKVAMDMGYLPSEKRFVALTAAKK